MRYIWVTGGSVVALGVILVWGVPATQRFLSADAFYERDTARYDDVRVGRFERSFSVGGKIVSSFSPKLFASHVIGLRRSLPNTFNAACTSTQ